MKRVIATLVVALAGLPAHADPDPPLRVGSKAFTESVILGELVAGVARDAGAPVEHRRGLGGTRLVWEALTGGAIDVYPEYTGTLAQELLVGERPPGTAAGDTDWLAPRLAARGLAMSAPLGFDNTYVLVMPEALAQRLGIRTISDLRAHPELRFGLSHELLHRHDGWPGLRARYGLPHERVRGVDHELAYRGLQAGSLDVADGYATDPELASGALRILRDDRGFFPRYQAVLVYRREAAERRPEVFRALGVLHGAIDRPTMARLNAEARLERRPETAVAAAFLEEKLGRGVTAGSPELGSAGRLRRVSRHTSEHLQLVLMSLLPAVLVAIPAGVLAARRPRLGQVVLGLAGLAQTIPSLALLVFMIPLLGIGRAPAVVALFAYSLLPIMRNTQAGLAGIAPALRESAEALGLPRRAILLRVELPLASPAILAGIKSAAVINVGTATLGALVGAGGLGEPIFTGIRLADVALVLEGAVPASALALLAQALFEGVERLAVPRGLRLRA